MTFIPKIILFNDRKLRNKDIKIYFVTRSIYLSPTNRITEFAKLSLYSELEISQPNDWKIQYILLWPNVDGHKCIKEIDIYENWCKLDKILLLRLIFLKISNNRNFCNKNFEGFKVWQI